MLYTIYQVNQNRTAFEDAGGRLFSGHKHWNPELFGFYSKVCEVDGRFCGLTQGDGIDYTITSKEEVFSILNQCYLDEETGEDIVFEKHVSGYEMKTITRKDGEVVTFRNMHSLSVGDIVAEVPQIGYEVMSIEDIEPSVKYFIVDSFGFKDITESLEDIDLASVKLETA
jgi:hypothetical protein